MKKGSVWRTMGAALMGIALALTLSACSVFTGLMAKPEGQATAKVVVQVGTYNLLTDHPEYREPVLAISGKVRQYIDGDALASVSDIMAVIDKQINWEKLKPEEAMAIQTLLTVVEMNLAEKINDKTLPEDVKLSVNMVIDWIEFVAKRPIYQKGGGNAFNPYTSIDIALAGPGGPVLMRRETNSMIWGWHDAGASRPYADGLVGDHAMTGRMWAEA